VARFPTLFASTIVNNPNPIVDSTAYPAFILTQRTLPPINAAAVKLTGGIHDN
jgi:hypothetical protein